MTAEPVPTADDFARCDAEPIRTPGAIQPHGAMLVLDATSLACTHASASLAGLVGLDPRAAVRRDARALLGAAIAERLGDAAADDALAAHPTPVGTLAVPGTAARCTVTAHRTGERLLVEIEPEGAHAERASARAQGALRAIVERFERAGSVHELCRVAAEGVRALLGHARVLVYRFDDAGNGEVLAESGSGALPSYLGLHFPATDIPAQARALYVSSRIRQIADAGYAPSPLLAADAAAPPVDLSFAWLRSVSPAHVAYMKAMGTAASMSVSIVVDGRLWGLLSCHDPAPRAIGAAERAACEQIGRVLSLQVAAQRQHARSQQRLERRESQMRVLAALADADDLAAGLVRAGDALRGLACADGVAVVVDGRVARRGWTPPDETVRAFAAWLQPREADVFDADRLADAWPEAPAAPGEDFGALAVTISELHPHCIAWFRRERVATIDWAGAVDAAPGPDGDGVRRAAAIGPARSFRVWRETVRGRCAPWDEVDREAALALRAAIVDIVLRRAEELAALAERIKAANAELEAFSYSVSHDLRAPLRHIAGYTELLLDGEAGALGERARHFAAHARDSARHAATLLDNLLAFSQMGRAALHPAPIALEAMVREIAEETERAERARSGAPPRRIEWRIGALPRVVADPSFLRLALANLLENAVKYTRGRDPTLVEVSAEARPSDWVVTVRDNGVGFDMAHVDKLFGVFQRLHRMEDFEGTGIGLANVRRIVARHGGRTWAEGRPGDGAAFSFTLPRSA